MQVWLLLNYKRAGQVFEAELAPNNQIPAGMAKSNLIIRLFKSKSRCEEFSLER